MERAGHGLFVFSEQHLFLLLNKVDFALSKKLYSSLSPKPSKVCCRKVSLDMVRTAAALMSSRARRSFGLSNP